MNRMREFIYRMSITVYKEIHSHLQNSYKKIKQSILYKHCKDAESTQGCVTQSKSPLPVDRGPFFKTIIYVSIQQVLIRSTLNEKIQPPNNRR